MAHEQNARETCLISAKHVQASTSNDDTIRRRVDIDLTI